MTPHSIPFQFFLSVVALQVFVVYVSMSCPIPSVEVRISVWAAFKLLVIDL